MLNEGADNVLENALLQERIAGLAAKEEAIYNLGPAESTLLEFKSIVRNDDLDYLNDRTIKELTDLKEIVEVIQKEINQKLQTAVQLKQDYPGAYANHVDRLEAFRDNYVR